MIARMRVDPNANAETMYRDKGCCKMGAFPCIRGEQGVNKKEHHHHVMAFCPFSVCVCDSGAWITLGACVSHEKCLVCFKFWGRKAEKRVCGGSQPAGGSLCVQLLPQYRRGN